MYGTPGASAATVVAKGRPEPCETILDNAAANATRADLSNARPRRRAEPVGIGVEGRRIAWTRQLRACALDQFHEEGHGPDARTLRLVDAGFNRRKTRFAAASRDLAPTDDGATLRLFVNGALGLTVPRW